MIIQIYISFTWDNIGWSPDAQSPGVHSKNCNQAYKGTRCFEKTIEKTMLTAPPIDNNKYRYFRVKMSV